MHHLQGVISKRTAVALSQTKFPFLTLHFVVVYHLHLTTRGE